MIPVPGLGFAEPPAAALCLVSILLVPLAMAGLALMNSGLGRSRSAAHMMVASLCAVSIAAIVFVVCGFSWDGFLGGPAHVWMMKGKPWDWIAAQPFFLRGIGFDGSPASLSALLQMFAVGFAALIPLSAAMDRWRLGAICASTAILAGCTFPIFAHWVWGGGWLAQLGINYGLGQGFLDTGGAGTIRQPLDGIWLRAPYLHNGSVPTLRDLLDPPEARPQVFYRGDDLYDQAKVGFRSDVAEENGHHYFRFDTALPGNGNRGHDYGTKLPASDKDAIVEYMKRL